MMRKGLFSYVGTWEKWEHFTDTKVDKWKIALCALTLAPWLVLMTGLPSSTAQEIGATDDQAEKVERAREEQKRTANASGVVINRVDKGNRSASIVLGVPPLLLNYTIQDETDMVSVVEALYPYYGFTGTETLKLESVNRYGEERSYTFREYIGGIETSQLIHVWVNERTGKIDKLVGILHVDQNLDRSPRMGEVEAIESTVRHIQLTEGVGGGHYLPDGSSFGEVIYRPWGEDWALTPVWRIFIERADNDFGPIEGSTGDANFSHGVFWVDPDGQVRRERVVAYASLVTGSTGR